MNTFNTSDPRILSSIIREAGRQADHYHNRGDTLLLEFWSRLEAMAFEAKRARKALLITEGKKETNHIPIKGGEQHEQLHNNNIVKAFQ